tara:strand:+ start:761 stop:943 length:183 start_codon:yes stop_codon:yes gene_type:complete
MGIFFEDRKERMTPQQRRNRAKWKRFWRKYRMPLDMEICVPFGIGLLTIGFITFYLLLSV